MKKIKHIINNHESAISPNLFDNIMAERNRRKKDPTVGFWLLSLSILSMLTVVSYFASTNNSSDLSATINEPIAANTIEPKVNLETRSIAPIVKQQTNTKENIQTNTISGKSTSFKKNPSALLQQPNITSKTLTQTTEIESNSAPTLSLPLPNIIANPIIANSATALSLPLPTLLPTALLASQPTIELPLPNNDCYTFTGRNRNGNSTFFIDFLGSPDYVKSNITAKTAEFKSYQKNRSATENYEFSYSAQFGVGLETGFGVVIRSGVNYSVYESRFHKSDPDFKKVTIEQIFDNQGNLLRIDTITTIGTLDIQHFNTHKYIGIPLTLGYTTSGRKLDIGVNLGAQFNIQTKSKGRFIGADAQTTDFTLFRNSQTPAYKTNIGLQGIANLTLAYEVTDHLDIIIAPHAKFTTKSITTKDNPLEEKLMTTGLWLGGRIRF